MVDALKLALGQDYKPIETVYNHYRFRSRLEARWAVFFDAAGIAYQYEPEGFELDGIRYLPDFWLPDLYCWVEIKGQYPASEEITKAFRLSIATQRDVYIFYGDLVHNPGKIGIAIGFEPHMLCFCEGTKHFRDLYLCPNRYVLARSYTPEQCLESAGQFGWIICEECGKPNIGYYDEMDYPHVNHDRHYCDEMQAREQRFHEGHEKIASAFVSGRQARFEHGEHGR